MGICRTSNEGAGGGGDSHPKNSERIIIRPHLLFHCPDWGAGQRLEVHTRLGETKDKQPDGAKIR